MKSSFEARPLRPRSEFVPRLGNAPSNEAPKLEEVPDASALAHDAGFAEGRAQAEEQLRAPLASAVRALGESLEALRTLHDDESGALADAVVELALAIAGRLVAAELRDDAEALAPLVAEALEMLGSDEPIELALSSGDAEQLRSGALPELERLRDSWNAELVEDPELRPGESIVRGGAATVDLRLAAMLERFRTGLAQPTRDAGEPS